jgi:hypothetical protein
LRRPRPISVRMSSSSSASRTLLTFIVLRTPSRVSPAISPRTSPPKLGRWGVLINLTKTTWSVATVASARSLVEAIRDVHSGAGPGAPLQSFRASSGECCGVPAGS